MRKAQKKRIEDFLKLLDEAHNEIQKALRTNDMNAAMDLLVQCQGNAITFGNLIEESEGEGCKTITFFEDYCEWIYQIHEGIGNGGEVNANDIHGMLKKALTAIEYSLENDIKVRLEIAFLPYKASMWDSLESVWMAADADPDCDAYVVPIPYYDRNADGTLGKYHYEAKDMPDYVPVTSYRAYNLEERQPDVIYIHNPYDHGNYITTVDPRYYSQELKKHTEMLVYIPYYTTAGGMAESQALCPAYLNVDYIVIQAEKYRKFFHPGLPDEKFLALGSPKFDRIMRLCNNPPAPPAEWKEKMQGKKVYFYNTSISGMLYDTRSFLKKMGYVFRCFEGREDACLLWRPHPLMESTFDSMRAELRPFYEELKQYFLRNNLGIYDNSPDIGNAISLCDAYIGDSGTSVTSLFGLAGKPVFILNNFIDSLPKEDDWRGEIVKGFYRDGHDQWRVTQGNKLYHSPNHDYQYEYYCDLSEYAAGGYYLRAMEIDGNVYVCPQNAQDILVIRDRSIAKRIPLERCVEQPGAFAAAWNIGDYLFLIPFKYPAVVRYDMKRDKVDYIKGYNEVFAKNVKGEWRVGGSCVWKNLLFIASPSDRYVLAIDSKTLKVQIVAIDTQSDGGCLSMVAEDDAVWLLPYTGRNIICWNPANGAVRTYSDMPEGFACKNRPLGYACEDRPFNMAVFNGQSVLLSPLWGNMFVSIDKKTGEARKWDAPFESAAEESNGYWMNWSMGVFLSQKNAAEGRIVRYYYDTARTLYDIHLERMEYTEIPLGFNADELYEHESGFCEESEWLQYSCCENAFNTLVDFLDGNIHGNAFDRNRQLCAYAGIAANGDGTSGEKIHWAIRERIRH